MASRRLLSLLLCFVFGAGLAHANIGFECESKIDVARVGTVGPPLKKGYPIIRGNTLAKAQGPSWELQADEIWSGGVHQGYELEMVLPPLKGFFTDTTADTKRFCKTMLQWTRALDDFCRLATKQTPDDNNKVKFTMKDVNKKQVEISSASIDTKLNQLFFRCTPQFTVSLSPPRLWCFLKETFAQHTRYHHVYTVTSVVPVVQRLVAIDNLPLSPAAKLLIYFVGTFVMTAANAGKTEPYLKTYTGTVLSRTRLGDVFKNGLTSTDKAYLTDPSTSLQQTIITIFAPTGYTTPTTVTPLFPHGWTSNKTPTLKIHTYLEDIVKGMDSIHMFYGDDAESFSSMAYSKLQEDWIVEFRAPAPGWGGVMSVFRNVMMRLYEQAHHFQHDPMTNGVCPTFPHTVADMVTDKPFPKGATWSDCQAAAATDFKYCA